MKAKKQNPKINYEKGFDIADYELTETDKSVLNLLIKFPEVSKTELAKRLNLGREHFSKITNKPAFKRAFNDIHNEEIKTWIQVIIDARKKASLKLVEHIDNENPYVSIRATENILQLDKLDLSDDSPEQSPY